MRDIIKTLGGYFLVLLFAGLPPFKLSVSGEALSRVNLKNEIRHDIIDYDENEELLLLTSASTFTINGQFTFNYTGIKNFTDSEHLYIWYIYLSHAAGHASLVLGSYTLHFGAGLLMGKKVFVSSDPFSRRFIASREKSLVPSANGNPVYSFSGAASEIYYQGAEYRISAIPFFSCQERFIDQESSEEGFITSSLATLNTKLYNEGGHEPVYIINYGIMTSITLYSHFALQAYGFETDLKKADLSGLRWDAEKYGIDEGISRMNYGGIFVLYADENISIFF